MKRNAPSTYSCTIARALEAFGDGWSWLILRDLFAGQSRFAAIQENLGIARNILSARLKQLLAAGIVEKIPDRAGSKYPEYILTEKGQALFPALIALNQWGDEYYAPSKGLASHVIDRRTAKPVRGLALLDEDGNIVPPHQLRHITKPDIDAHGWPEPEEP